MSLVISSGRQPERQEATHDPRRSSLPPPLQPAGHTPFYSSTGTWQAASACLPAEHYGAPPTNQTRTLTWCCRPASTSQRIVAVLALAGRSLHTVDRIHRTASQLKVFVCCYCHRLSSWLRLADDCYGRALFLLLLLLSTERDVCERSNPLFVARSRNPLYGVKSSHAVGGRTNYATATMVCVCGDYGRRPKGGMG